jgi:hypothetical protein
MGPIQNRSGHGIDWIGRPLTGNPANTFVAFEIKGGLNGRADGLVGDQRSITTSVPSRANRGADAKGVWAERNTAPGTDKFAKFVLREMRGKNWSGYLIQHHNMRTQPSVSWSPWPK